MRRAVKPLPLLGELEEAVLEHLWRQGESDVVSAHAALGEPRGITLNTVGSALERLFKKGLARRHKVSHAYRYAAVLGREAYAVQRAIDAAGGLKALASAGVLSAFIDVVADVDEDALDRIEALVAEKRQDRCGS